MTTARVEALRQWMQEQGAGAVVLITPENQHYITGFRALIYSRPILTVITRDRVDMIVPGLEEVHARAESAADNLHVYYEHPEGGPDRDPLAVLIRVLAQHLDHGRGGSRRLGVEFGGLPHAYARALSAEGYALVDAGAHIARLRLVKDAGEIELIRKAAQVVSEAVVATLAASQPGRSELEIEEAGNRVILERTAQHHQGMFVDALVMSPSGSVRTVMPHVLSNTRRLEVGDVIIHSRQVGLNGYRAECERTYFIGQPSQAQRRAFEVMVAAQQAAIERVAPGVRCSEVDRAAREIIQRAGYGAYAVHRTGHGLGLSAHEGPYLRFDDDSLLQPGMVVSIEPGIYIPGLGGFRHSDTVIVTDTGYEVVTTGPRDPAGCTLQA